jgi:phosphoenolpyruvate carboxykinase (ATP)
MIEDLGVRNPSAEIGLTGLNTSGLVRYNTGEAELVELAVARGEAKLSAHGALRAPRQAIHTGRSAKDKYVVRDETTSRTISGGTTTSPMEPEAFETPVRGFHDGTCAGHGPVRHRT